jgi:tRNA U34 5-methylaminomethyl-2-thiouridine-forming methyltransferase MnmC
MDFETFLTLDGSKTLKSNLFGECYHSTNGAIVESEHIFINLGLKSTKGKNINILEIGYGTGLNALLTYRQNLDLGKDIYYHGIDVYPLNLEIAKQLSYEQILITDEEVFVSFYSFWNQEVEISAGFKILKEEVSIENLNSLKTYDLVYFDAFSPETQPEMWTVVVFEKLYKLMNPNSILVTYSSKGIVKQNLRAAGFVVQRHSGPPGKRHVIRATKL